MEIAYKEKATGEVNIVEDSTHTPVSKFPPNLYTKLYEQATVEAKDILAIHKLKCPNPVPRLQLSCDGVAECRSNSVSLDVYSCKTINCRQIYPKRIIRPINRHRIDHDRNLRDVLDDLTRNSCTVNQFVGDNPKRATAKGVLNHSSSFPCEYYFACATRLTVKKTEKNSHVSTKIKLIEEKIEQLKEEPSTSAGSKEIKKLELIKNELLKTTRKKSQLVWPASSRNAEYRTKEKIENILEKMQDDPNLPHAEKKGIVRRSPLMDLDNFDIVMDVPVEYMHGTCIGVVKRMVELTFDVGENRPRVTKRKLSLAAEFNKLMLQTKFPGELSRRARELDFAVMKASEYRNLIIFFFPLVVECIQENEKERVLWLYLAFLIRACVLPTEEFQSISLTDEIDYYCEKFYVLYEKLFGEINCTYNTHVVSAHLREMRYHGPLTFTSAFPFENFYGELRNSFTPGTQSTLKQIFERIMIKRTLGHHRCVKSLLLTAHDTPLECNTLIYTYKHSSYRIYKIFEINEEDLICKEIETEECSFDDAPKRMKWSKIGVFFEGSLKNDIIVIPSESVGGKVVRVGKYLITCPCDVLNET